MWRDVIDTNLTGMFLMTQAGLAVMKRGSAIVNNLSIAAERVFPGSAAYSASSTARSASPIPCAKNCERREFASLRCCRVRPIPTSGPRLWPKAPRYKMMSASTVARTVVNALLLPANSAVEKVIVMPTGGAL